MLKINSLKLLLMEPSSQPAIILQSPLFRSRLSLGINCLPISSYHPVITGRHYYDLIGMPHACLIATWRKVRELDSTNVSSRHSSKSVFPPYRLPRVLGLPRRSLLPTTIPTPPAINGMAMKCTNGQLMDNS
jgi:hypothetical protein